MSEHTDMTAFSYLLPVTSAKCVACQYLKIIYKIIQMKYQLHMRILTAIRNKDKNTSYICYKMLY